MYVAEGTEEIQFTFYEEDIALLNAGMTLEREIRNTRTNHKKQGIARIDDLIVGFNINYDKSTEPKIDGTYTLLLSKEMLLILVEDDGKEDFRAKTKYGHIQINYHKF